MGTFLCENNSFKFFLIHRFLHMLREFSAIHSIITRKSISSRDADNSIFKSFFQIFHQNEISNYCQDFRIHFAVSTLKIPQAIMYFISRGHTESKMYLEPCSKIYDKTFLRK